MNYVQRDLDQKTPTLHAACDRTKKIRKHLLNTSPFLSSRADKYVYFKYHFSFSSSLGLFFYIRVPLYL